MTLKSYLFSICEITVKQSVQEDLSFSIHYNNLFIFDILKI